ncbi:MAG: orotidine 5'-phosphate decarboxylase [Spirochaetales bacterium]|nr:orotidine 5'-phosphate decarboxylase [Spirochaetales bacterium]
MSNAKLQVALDFVDLHRAIDVAQKASEGGADYIEAGTPLIKSEGLNSIRKLRDLFPDKTIIADMKTMDAGKIEAEAAAKAGANIITVLGTATMNTIRECVETGHHYGIKVAVDLLGVRDPFPLIKKYRELGVAWIDVHCAIDAQMEGKDPLEQLKLIRKETDLIVAVAGGLNSETAAFAVEAGADVIIVGGAITKAIDVKKAAEAIKQAMNTCKPVETTLFKRTGEADLRRILTMVRTSNISDGTHRLPCLYGIKQLIKGTHICGPAVTVRTIPGDWAKPVEAIDVAKQGEVIVINAYGQPPAIWGELASESAKNKGIAGIVVNGAVRDTGDIRKLNFPVWTKLVVSEAGDPHGLGEINTPVTISGQKIEPGDWIVADDDGVMVLPGDRVVEMANRAADVLEAENRIRQEIKDLNSTLAKVVDLKKWEKRGVQGAIG